MDDSPGSPPAADETSGMVIEALSRADGKTSTIRVFPDRIEWLKEESISSLPRPKSEPPVIPLRTVASVRLKQDGPLFSKVFLRTEEQAIVFRMYSPQAAQFRDAVAALLAAEPAPRAEEPPTGS